jgi:hypothetical protein
MNSIKFRWWQVIAILLVAVMVFSAFKTVPAVARPVRDGEAEGAVAFAVSPSLRSISPRVIDARVFDALSSDPFGIVKEHPYNLQIPSRRNAKGSINVPPGPRDITPLSIQPGKKIFDIPMPNVDLSMNGLNQGSNRTLMNYGVYPPDTNGAISSDFYIQTVNGTMAIWDLRQASMAGNPGKVVYGPATVNSLWSNASGVCNTTNDGDPIAIWDNAAKRFLVTQFALPKYPVGPFYECIAISKTSNPMDGFYLYTFKTHGNMMDDYPKFGVWQDGYYLSVNQFDANAGFAWAGAGVAVFERAKMLVGNPAARIIYIDTSAKCQIGTEPVCSLGGMLPSDVEGPMPPAGTPNYFMQFDDDAWGYSGDQLQIWEFKTNWVTGTATFTKKQSLPVTAFDSEVCTGYARDCLSQPDTARGLDAIADRLMYRLVYRRFGTYSAMVANHTVKIGTADPKGQAGIRWYELRAPFTTNSWSVYQQGTLAPDASNRWMGSIAIDRLGNIAIGYSISDATIYPNMAYSGRKPSDPLGTLPQTETYLVSTDSAAGSQTGDGSRWGDYSTLDVAPDGCYFWFTSEYYRGTTPVEWYTMIGAFKFDACSDAPTVPTTIGPVGTTTKLPTFSWNSKVGATSYTLKVVNKATGAVRIADKPLSGLYCSAATGICKFTPTSAFTAGTYQFSIAAVNWSGATSGYPAQSTWKTFIVP